MIASYPTVTMALPRCPTCGGCIVGEVQVDGSTEYGCLLCCRVSYVVLSERAQLMRKEIERHPRDMTPEERKEWFGQGRMGRPPKV